MHLKFKLRWLAAALILLAFTASCASAPVLPTPLPAASASPLTGLIKINTPDSEVKVNDVVRVSVSAENVANFTAFETHLLFDPIILEVTEIVDGKLIAPDFTVQNVFDNVAGTIDYAVAQMNRAPASGSGILFEVVFRAKAQGDSVIRFHGTPAAPAGILLSDSDGLAVQISVAEGSVLVK